ncbi:hypothetical protein IT575_13360 [bacterium]|nr:hypothetical protein [bacterium]
MGLTTTRNTGGWDITDCQFENAGTAAQIFNFELAIYGTEAQPGFVLRGDGLIFGDGRVRFNREVELMQILSTAGENPQKVLDGVAARLRSRAGARVPSA